MLQQYQDAANEARMQLILVAVFVIFFVILFLRMAFNVPTFLKHTKIQTALLIEISKKAQVESDVIDEITSELNSEEILKR